MSSIVVVSIEGVITDPNGADSLPTASPSLPSLRLVRALSTEWPVAYVTTAPREVAVEWLRSVGAVSPVWVVSSPLELRAKAVLAQLAERRDRAQLFITATAHGLDELAGARITSLLLSADEYPLGDWRQESSWLADGGDEEDGIDDMVRRG